MSRVQRTWRVTDLSVSPDSWQMGSGDTEAFGFDAEEPIAAATATLRRLDTLAEAGTVGEPAIAGTIATVTVGGLTRGIVYELTVTFEAAATSRVWSRVLVIPCVA